MEAKKLYTHLYKLLENVTPIEADCGKLCNAACCEGDDETGMYLFPFEETMYDGTEKWLKIYDSDFIFNGKPVKLATCNRKCDRKKRPLSCRIFPLFSNEMCQICADKRASHLCPLVAGKIQLEKYNPEFIENVTKVFKILQKFKITRDYIKETQKIIDEYDEIQDIFQK